MRKIGVLAYLFIFIFFFIRQLPYERETSVMTYLLTAIGDNSVPSFFSRLCA